MGGARLRQWGIGGTGGCGRKRASQLNDERRTKTDPESLRLRRYPPFPSSFLRRKTEKAMHLHPNQCVSESRPLPPSSFHADRSLQHPPPRPVAPTPPPPLPLTACPLSSSPLCAHESDPTCGARGLFEHPPRRGRPSLSSTAPFPSFGNNKMIYRWFRTHGGHFPRRTPLFFRRNPLRSSHCRRSMPHPHSRNLFPYASC